MFGLIFKIESMPSLSFRQHTLGQTSWSICDVSMIYYYIVFANTIVFKNKYNIPIDCKPTI